MTSEEARWVMRAKAGDRAAFAAHYERYERRVYGFLYRMLGDADDAADLTQETFLKAYRALDKTGMDLDVSAWLHRIAANACLDLLRRRQCWLEMRPRASRGAPVVMMRAAQDRHGAHRSLAVARRAR